MNFLCVLSNRLADSHVTSSRTPGVILARRWLDAPTGTELEYCVATDAGPVKVVLVGQQSVSLVKVRDFADVELQLPALPGMDLCELALKTFSGDPVLGIYAKQHRSIGRLSRALKSKEISLYAADVRPDDR